jgi:hypothetical protein
MNLKTTLSKYSGKPNSLFKKIFVTFSFAYLPFLILFSILVSFGIMPVNFNEQNIYGLKGVVILVALLLFLLLSLVLLLTCGLSLEILFYNYLLHFCQIKNHSRIVHG